MCVERIGGEFIAIGLSHTGIKTLITSNACSLVTDYRYRDDMMRTPLKADKQKVHTSPNIDKFIPQEPWSMMNKESKELHKLRHVKMPREQRRSSPAFYLFGIKCQNSIKDLISYLEISGRTLIATFTEFILRNSSYSLLHVLIDPYLIPTSRRNQNT